MYHPAKADRLWKKKEEVAMNEASKIVGIQSRPRQRLGLQRESG
jgi:hypothetical protein